MRDYVKALSSSYEYEEYYNWILDNSELVEGGLLKPNSHVVPTYLPADELNFDSAFLWTYDKYLCSDGIIRFTKTNEKENEAYACLTTLNQAEFDRCNRFMEEHGFIWVEVDCCWRNPTTGEEQGY